MSNPLEATKPANKRRKRKGSQAAGGGVGLSKKGASPRPNFSLASQVPNGGGHGDGFGDSDGDGVGDIGFGGVGLIKKGALPRPNFFLNKSICDDGMVTATLLVFVSLAIGGGIISTNLGNLLPKSGQKS